MSGPSPEARAAGGPSDASSAGDPPDDRRYVSIGEVVAPFGHKGEIKIYPLTGFPRRLLEIGTAALQDAAGSLRTYPILQARLHKNVVVMRLEGVSTMTDAEALRGLRLVVPPESRHPLPGGTFYVDDLIGLNVVTDDGRDLGVVRNVLAGPANDVYDVGGILIPAIRDVVVRVDLESRTIVIHPVPGLLDEPETA